MPPATLPAWAEPRTDVPRVAAAGPLLSTIDHWLNVPGERQFLHLSGESAARDGVLLEEMLAEVLLRPDGRHSGCTTCSKVRKAAKRPP